MRILVVVSSLALALAGCLKAPESDNTGLLLPLAEPDTAVAGTAGGPPMTTSVLAVGAGYVSATLPAGGRHRFSFATEPNAVYSIQWDEYDMARGYDLDVTVTALADDGTTQLYEQHDGVPFSKIDYSMAGYSYRLVVAGSAAGTYYLEVSPHFSAESGSVGVRVDRVSSQISKSNPAVADTLLENEGFVRCYSFSATSGTSYTITWTDHDRDPLALHQYVILSVGQMRPTAAPIWSDTYLFYFSSPTAFVPTYSGQAHVVVRPYMGRALFENSPGFQIELD